MSNLNKSDLESLLEDAIQEFGDKKPERLAAEKLDLSGNEDSKSGKQDPMEEAVQMLQNVPLAGLPMPSDEDLEKMFREFTMSSDGESASAEDQLNGMMPMFETMLESLLSKELMYPAIRQLAEKFPDWLADNRGTLSDKLYQNHNKQFQLCQQMCEIYETEGKNGKLSKEAYEKLFELMNQMQACGNPPSDLMPSSDGLFDKAPCTVS